MEDNKLKEEINSILEEEIGGLHHTDYKYNDKLYSLTAGVARKYGRYLLEGNIGSFEHFITHIYQPK